MATARVLLSSPKLRLSPLAARQKTRVLAWHGNALFCSSGYDLLRADPDARSGLAWSVVARYRPSYIRRLSSQIPLGYRLLRDGFHALAILSSGRIVGAVPHEIVTLQPGDSEFHTSFKIPRGTRPLHIAIAPPDTFYWGEYFDNPMRDEVHIYASSDQGSRWDVAFTFPKNSIRHVHNILYDRWGDCLWILTGDTGDECRIIRASTDFRSVDVVVAGHQQARAVALVPTPTAIYLSSDTPFETNHIYRLDRSGKLSRVFELSSSSIYGCAVGSSIFFSTMVEPSEVNLDRHSRVFGSADTNQWSDLMSWKKDRHSEHFFQYGNTIFPDGENETNLLALTTVAVEGHNLETGIWRVEKTESS